MTSQTLTLRLISLLVAPLLVPALGCDDGGEGGEAGRDDTLAIQALGSLEFDAESACFLTYLDCFDATEDAVACKLDFVACAYPNEPASPTEPGTDSGTDSGTDTKPEPGDGTDAGTDPGTGTDPEPDGCMPTYDDCIADGGEPVECKELYNACANDSGN
jgi:hypothetical protein